MLNRLMNAAVSAVVMPAAGAAIVASVALSATRASGQSCGTMQDLGTLHDQTGADDVSADGSVVVGRAFTGFNDTEQVFRWTVTEGMTNLGTLGGRGNCQGAYVSANGTVVVGETRNGAEERRAFRWTAEIGMQDLGTFGGSESRALGVSSDGGVIVGFALDAAGLERAFRWSLDGGMQNLGTLGGINSRALGVSSDGSVVVGWAQNADGATRAFRWTEAGGLEDLGTLPGFAHSHATLIAASAAAVVGWAYEYDFHSDTITDHRAFRWTAADGLQDLGTFTGYEVTRARAVSADGETVVGHGSEDLFITPSHAFRWTVADGFSDLGTLCGQESYARAVSANGRVIAGTGYTFNIDSRACRWGATGDIRSLGTPASGDFYGSGANAISEDGDVVVGYGVSTSQGVRAFRWLRNRADFNDDGFVSGDDFDLYVEAFELGDVAADFNRDGFVTGDDFDEFVEKFGAGCERRDSLIASLDRIFSLA